VADAHHQNPKKTPTTNKKQKTKKGFYVAIEKNVDVKKLVGIKGAFAVGVGVGGRCCFEPRRV
jgi:hypothetical protein